MNKNRLDQAVDDSFILMMMESWIATFFAKMGTCSYQGGAGRDL
jgi:hypothetical protein